MLQVRTFHGHDTPMVEFLVDGVWCEGFLRAWRQHDDGSWTAQVSWSRGVGQSSRLDVFAASDVRRVDEEQWLRDYFARRAAEGNPVPEHLTGAWVLMRSSTADRRLPSGRRAVDDDVSGGVS